MILPDASTWVAHLKRRDDRLVRHLAENRVVTCDVVMGALLLVRGIPLELLRHLALLPRIPSPGAAETGTFIERHRETLRKARADWAQAQVLLAAIAAGATLLTSETELAVAWKHLSREAHGSAQPSSRSW